MRKIPLFVATMALVFGVQVVHADDMVRLSESEMDTISAGWTLNLLTTGTASGWLAASASSSAIALNGTATTTGRIRFRH